MKHKAGCNISFGDEIYLADEDGVVDLPKEYPHLNPMKDEPKKPRKKKVKDESETSTEAS